MSESVGAYLAYLTAKGRTESTISYLRNAVARLVPDGPLAGVTVAKARAQYAAIATTGEYAASTHQNSLAVTATMWAWFIRQDWCQANPWDEVETLGQAKQGKPQLSLDEARLFVDVAYREAERASGPVAVLLAFLLGMRAGEVVGLHGHDIDDGGRLVRIERGKTRKAKRVLEVPERLRPFVVALAAKSGAVGRLFPWDRVNVGYWTRKLCRMAGVRVVCPHGLRGTHTTIAIGAGATAQLVAAAIGHASVAITRAHYIAPGSEDRANASLVADRLTGNGNWKPVSSPTSDDAN